MGKQSRLKSDGELTEQQVADRDYWCRRILAWPKGSRQRGTELRAAVEALKLKRSRIYQILEAYEDAEAGGKAALRRKPRSDLGVPRAGTADLRSEARRLEELGFTAEAESRRKEAARLATAMKAAWVDFVSNELVAHRETTELARAFAKLHPDWNLPTCETLQAWRNEIAPEWTMTDRELRQAVKIGHRVVAAHANHVWQADQHTADLEVREPIVDPHTGEITGERVFRPYLFLFVDRYSGLIMGGGYFEQYDTACVEAALLESIYPAPGRAWCGVPRFLYWDNGKQHWNGWTEGMARHVGLTMIPSTPREPTTHGFVENNHKLIVARFENDQPGYTGPDNTEAGRPLARRIEREERREIERRLTLAELNEAFRAWLPELATDSYNDGPSRLSLWQASAIEDRQRMAVPDRDDLGWAFMYRDRRKVDREGFIRHENRYYVVPGELGLLCDTWVEIRYLKGDASRIYIADDRGIRRAVCHLRPNLVFHTEVSRQVTRRDDRAARETRRSIRKDKQRVAVLADLGLVDRQTAEAGAAALDAADAALRPERISGTEFAVAMKRAEQDAGEGAGLAEVVTLIPKPDTRPLATDPDPRGSDFLGAVVSTAAAAVETREKRPRKGAFDL